MNYMFFSKKVNIACARMFKIVDLDFTQSHDTKATIYFLIDYFNKNFNQKFKYFSINYGHKEFRSLEGFIKYLEKVDKSKLCYISMYSLDENISLTITHPLRNYLKGREPKLNCFDIFLDVYKRELENTKILELVKAIIIMEDLDYSYLFETYNRIYAVSEYISSLFKKDIGFELNASWQDHTVGIKSGYLKKLYKYNFINESQLNQPIVKKCYDLKIGKFERINENMSFWQLDDLEFKTAYDFFKNTPWLMCDENCYQSFLNSDDAKHFNFLMG